MKKYGDEEVDKLVEKWWRQRHGFVPDYIDTWAKLSPQSFKGYVGIRTAVYAKGKGVLPQKVKELIVVAIEATLDRQAGLNNHIQRAFDAGATKEEVFEALMLSFIFAIGVRAPQLGATSLKEEATKE